jgi:virginiamycin B lyase
MVLIALLLWAPAAGAVYDKVTEFPANNAGPIVAGSDGNIWMGGVDKVMRIAPAGEMTEFPTPTSQLPVLDMALGADGNVWLAQSDPPVAWPVGTVARVTPAGQVTEFPLSTRETQPLSISSGAGYRLALSDGDQAGWVDMNGTMTLSSLASASGEAKAVALDRHGNVWFTEVGGRIGQLTPNGRINEYQVPGNPFQLGGIALGADGNLWFTIPEKEAIGRVAPDGRIRVFPILPPENPERAEGGLSGITAGPDGRLWFTEGRTGSLGWVNPFRNVIGRLLLPSTNETHPEAVTAGPEGNLWYSALTGHFEGGSTNLIGQHLPRVGRISPQYLAAHPGEVHSTAGNRQLRVRLACSGGRARGICRGRLRVRAEIQGRGGRIRRQFVPTRGRYAVPTDSARKIALPLTLKSRILISRHHPLLSVRILASGPSH